MEFLRNTWNGSLWRQSGFSRERVSRKHIIFVCLLVVFLPMWITDEVSGADSDIDSYRSVLWQTLSEICHLGPRPPGSDGQVKLREMILETGRQFADDVTTQEFEVDGEGTDPVLKLMNIELKFKGTGVGRSLLIGTHYDTRPIADEDPIFSNRDKPIPGANDGGSGTAILLGLARYMKKKPPPGPVTLVFFDGEDLGLVNKAGYLIGSQYYASVLEKNPSLEKPSAVIVLDMVGDRNLEIYRESYSVKNAPDLVNRVFDIAIDRYQLDQFKDSVKYSILDDHMPFVLLGIPSMVLIDFDYPYWHRMSDTLDKCSPESLMAVFRVVTDLVREWVA